MLSKKTKALLKPLAYVVIAAPLTGLFLWLSAKGIVREETEIPHTLAWLISFATSLRSFWLMPAALAILLVMAMDFTPFVKARRFLRCAYLAVLGLLSGKFYLMAVLYFAYSYSAHHVGYMRPLNNALIISICAVLLGLVVWFGGRALASGVLRWWSNNSSKPMPLRGA